MDVKVGGTCIVGETGVDMGFDAPPDKLQADRISPRVSSKRRLVFVVILFIVSK